MTTDFLVEPGLYFGDWLHREIGDSVHYERNGFMPDRVRRVAERLQTDRIPEHRFIVEVPWIRCFTAFTAPGRYIYFGRRLLERCPDDETVAFVIAHEIAHHDLGHLAYFRGVFAQHAARIQAGALTILFFRILQKRIYSPEWELDADRSAVEMCVDAGYDGRKCLRLFDVLERFALDFGDLDAVYGLDAESEDELSPEASLMTKTRIWLWQRQRGYLPIQDRRAMALRHYRKLSSPFPWQV
jgi:predicted Zn-dependent protease